MGGICPQDTKYWCPLQGDSCISIPKSCVLLVAGKGSDVTLSQVFALQYVQTTEGQWTIEKRLPEKEVERIIVIKREIKE